MPYKQHKSSIEWLLLLHRHVESLSTSLQKKVRVNLMKCCTQHLPQCYYCKTASFLNPMNFQLQQQQKLKRRRLAVCRSFRFVLFIRLIYSSEASAADQQCRVVRNKWVLGASFSFFTSNTAHLSAQCAKLFVHFMDYEPDSREMWPLIEMYLFCLQPKLCKIA